MEALQDSELAELCSEGKQEAFSCLIERHYMFIYKVSYKWLGNKEDAEDLAQDVCVKLAHKIGLYTPNAKFTTWLYKVIVNAARDFIKSSAQKQIKYDIDDFAIQSGDQNQEEIMIQAQMLEKLNLLPTKIKEAVILVYMEGMSHAEAAEILNCAETTISWRVFQGKKKLKSILRGVR